MRVLGSVVICLMVVFSCHVIQAKEDAQWADVVEKARGQVVYFNGWGGSDTINDYVRWAGEQVENRYGVEVVHVKVTDIGEVVGRILAEKSAGRNDKGTVDLMWINGENFRAMKEQGLLPAPYTQLLPNYALVDTENKPTTMFDFTVPVENLEAPWGMAQLVFIYDSAKLETPPKNMQELLAFAKSHPGRVTYPAPPAFHGTTFVKQALLELAAQEEVLTQPVSKSDFDAVTAPLWQFLDELHPHMWRSGRSFTSSSSEMKQLLADGEIVISLTFNPNDASNAIANGELPETVRTYVHQGGTIGNTHFLATVFNSSNKEGAMVFTDFLLSPEAQARKADPAIWGDPTVLAMDKLTAEDRARFSRIKQGVATLTPEQLGKVRLEPHASWVEALEKAWQKRYSR